MPKQQKTSALTLSFRAKDICCCRYISTALSQQKTSAAAATLHYAFAQKTSAAAATLHYAFA